MQSAVDFHVSVRGDRSSVYYLWGRHVCILRWLWPRHAGKSAECRPGMDSCVREWLKKRERRWLGRWERYEEWPRRSIKLATKGWLAAFLHGAIPRYGIYQGALGLHKATLMYQNYTCVIGQWFISLDYWRICRGVGKSTSTPPPTFLSARLKMCNCAHSQWWHLG